MFRSLSRAFKSIANNQNGFIYYKPTRLNSNTPSGRLEGKVAIVTGGAGGLGKATAQQFIKNGAQVIIADIDTEIGPKVAEELGPSAHFIECDVTEEAQLAEAVQTAVARHGKLDIMYNNAGITGPAVPPGIADLDLEGFDRVMCVNLRGTVGGIKQASRVMVAQGWGSILCTASISGLIGGVGPHPYSVSKSAIVGLVKSVASDLCKSGVRINCISPGPVATPMSLAQFANIYRGATEEQVRDIFSGLGDLKGATCHPIDVANAAVYLASDEASFITGHNLVIDGGFTSFKHLNMPNPSSFSST